MLLKYIQDEILYQILKLGLYCLFFKNKFDSFVPILILYLCQMMHFSVEIVALFSFNDCHQIW